MGDHAPAARSHANPAALRGAYPLCRAGARLQRERFDVLVIGGGIYGAWTACDAARRGLTVALVEARDWAAGTSSASSKLVHGGLRYLEQLEIGLVRESLAERRRLSRIAPHRVRPLRFVLPVWGGNITGYAKLGLGLALYDLLAGFHQPVQRHQRLSAARLRHDFPWLAPESLRGGFSYGDCQHDDARTTLDVVAAAQAAGAACANHLAAEALLQDGERVVGARLHDIETGERYELRATAVVAAAGPWSGRLAGEAAKQIERVRGAHLILPAIPGCNHAFLFAAPQDGRAFFVIPWYGRSLVGTTESAVSADTFDDPCTRSDAETACAEEQRYLLDAVAARLPGLGLNGTGWGDADVIASFAGTRSLHYAATQHLSNISREFDLLQPQPGLWLPLGGKFTTARLEAQSIVDTLLVALGRPPAPCTTATTPLPGAPTGPFAEWQAARIEALKHNPSTATLDSTVLSSLLSRYGTRINDIIELLDDDPRLATRLHDALPFIGAEVVLARRDEMARDLDDTLRRRVPLSILARAEDGAARGAPQWRARAGQLTGFDNP